MNGSNLLEQKLTTWAKVTKPAIIEADTDRSISFQELLWAVNALKTHLSKPQTILMAIPSGITNSIIWFSSLTGGHRLVPVSPNLTDYEYQQLISQHHPDLIINSQNLAEIEKIIDQGIAKKITSTSEPKHGQLYLSTSGSTGTPKGVVLDANQITITAQNIADGHQLTDQDRGLTCLPFYHVNAPVVSLITTILSGSTLIIAPKYSTSQFWEWVEKYDPTWISLVPTMIAMLLSTDKPDFLAKSNLRFIRTASEPLPKENLKRFEDKFGIPLIETYGLTEAASTITANPVPPQIHKPGSVGLPLGVEIKICVPNSDLSLPPQTTGEVWVKGENVITHYEQNRGSESFYQGWFKTGDLGYRDQDGFIYLTGRIKDIIIRGGENIIPREIEEVLLTHPNLKEASVVGHPDPIYGEKVVAFVVLNKMTIPTEIKDYLSQKLVAQKVPSQIYIMESLPRNKNNKVDKPFLRKFQPKSRTSKI